jgi:ornithine cyclodeaminase/alanine dehydrogenase-like protein (mu-crystallin family)
VALARWAAENLASWARQALGVDAVVENDLQTAVADAEVVTVAASRVKPLVIQNDWLAPEATVLVSGPISADDAFWLDNHIVLDHVALHEAYVEEAVASPDKQAAYNGVIGGPLYRLIDDERLPPLKDFTDLGTVLQAPADRDHGDGRRTVFIACGMSVFDLGWGFETYSTALAKGIGTPLTLWDTPFAE